MNFTDLVPKDYAITPMGRAQRVGLLHRLLFIYFFFAAKSVLFLVQSYPCCGLWLRCVTCALQPCGVWLSWPTCMAGFPHTYLLSLPPQTFPLTQINTPKACIDSAKDRENKNIIYSFNGIVRHGSNQVKMRHFKRSPLFLWTKNFISKQQEKFIQY